MAAGSVGQIRGTGVVGGFRFPGQRMSEPWRREHLLKICCLTNGVFGWFGLRRIKNASFAVFR